MSRRRAPTGAREGPIYASHPSYIARPMVVTCVARAFDDLEEAFGRYCKRSGPRFMGFLMRRPEYPCVVTTLPFIAIEQLLFAVTNHSWGEMFIQRPGHAMPKGCKLSQLDMAPIAGQSCPCPNCSQLYESTSLVGVHAGPFAKLIDLLASKYGARSKEFVLLAYQILGKVAADTNSFVAVYVGPEGVLGCLPTGPRDAAPRYRTQRVFEWRVSGVPGAPLADDVHIIPSVIPLARKSKTRLPTSVDCDPFSKPWPTADKLSIRVTNTVSHREFGTAVIARFVRATNESIPYGIVRAYLVGEPAIPFVSMGVRATPNVRPFPADMPRPHGVAPDSKLVLKEYDLDLLRGFPWTNVEFSNVR
jgi:hypothetical protein